MARTRVKWIEHKTFLGTGSNGNAALMTSGDEGPGVSPMQMLLLGLGGCASVDVVDILRKQRQPLQGLEVAVEGERGEEAPRPWQTIHMHFMVSGEGLDPAKVERAINLSVEKYCGVHATLSGIAHITHDFEICQAGEPLPGEVQKGA
jgi:putative redox protein